MRLFRTLMAAAGPTAVAMTLLAACGDDAQPSVCTVGDDSTCASGLVCAPVVGSTTPGCFAPVYIQGSVLDDAAAGIAGANVVALDVNGSAVSSTATSATDGSYELAVPATRNADGSVASLDVTLRAGAQGYLPFPKAPRYALPLPLDTAVLSNGRYVLDTTSTDIVLLALPAGSPASATIGGTVTGAGVAGGLVVAVQGGVAVSTAIVASDGTYTLFNVPLGSTTIEVYHAGVAVDPLTVTLGAGGLTDQNLSVDTGVALGTVNGGLQFVDASGGAAETSVILVPASTFDPDIVRGEAPAGLRVVVPTSGANFSITGVPPGDYVVLAAFENDDLVRDPDQTQGGTAVLKITVAAGATVDAGSFKITGALRLVGPGATGTEIISTTTPTFRWYNDPSAGHFELRVYDAYGTPIFEDLAVPAGSGNQMVSYALPAADALMDGMTYQWRLFSVDSQGITYISASEDLEGVFVVNLP